MKYLDWLKTNPQKGYYWVRPYDCYEERIDEFTDWYDNAGNVETKFTEQPEEVISDRLIYIDYLDMVGHCGAYSEENKKLKEELKEICEKYLKIKTTVSAYEDAYKDLHTYIKQLKDLLKEIRGKIHYINTPKNRHNIFDKYFVDKIDEVLQ